MADSTQVHELLRMVQHPQLQDTVKALEVRPDLGGITYLEAANHLTAAVSKMPEYQFSRKVSEVQSNGGNSGGSKGGGGVPRKGGCNSGSIYNYQGKVRTGYYQNWKVLSEEYCKAVISVCKERVASLVRPQSRRMYRTPSVRYQDYQQPLLK